MTGNKQELLSALLTVRPGLSERNAVEQSDSVALVDGVAITYNDFVSVRHPLPKAFADLSGAVRLTPFIGLLEAMEKDDITITVSDNGFAIASGNTKATITVDADVRQPFSEVKIPSSWNELPSDFSEALEFASFSVSSDVSRPILCCVKIGGAVISSTDDDRVTMRKMASKISGEMLLPSASIKSLLAFVPTHYAIADGWLHFKNKGKASFSTRTILDANYPDLTSLFKLKNVVAITLPKELREGLQQAEIVLPVDDSNPSVEISAKEGMLILSARGPVSSLKKRYKVDFKETICIHGNPRFLRDALGIASVVSVASDRLLIEGKDFRHIVALHTPAEE